jgi:4-hydroxy-4-methyl-2-oxoglutarate aldolase
MNEPIAEKDVIASLSQLDTATVSDALDRLGIAGQCADIHPRADTFRLCGVAFTVRYGPADSPPGTVGDYLDDVAPGQVVMLDNQGSSVGTVWGDILTESASIRAIGGTVIDGLCRDVSLCRNLVYPVFSRGSWMRTGKDRMQVESIGTAITIGGVRVTPGDFVLGDSDGIVTLPSSRASEIIETAFEIHHAEEGIRTMIRNGATIREARSAFGYHALQSRTRP